MSTRQPITYPDPEPPVSVTALSPAGARRVYTTWLPMAAALIVGALAGGAIARPSNPAIEPSRGAAIADLHSTLSWMFDAALAHEAIDDQGARVGAVVSSITVKSVDVIDAVTGPIVAVVASPSHGLSVYEISVVRDDLNWDVHARRIDANRSESAENDIQSESSNR